MCMYSLFKVFSIIMYSEITINDKFSLYNFLAHFMILLENTQEMPWAKKLAGKVLFC